VGGGRKERFKRNRSALEGVKRKALIDSDGGGVIATWENKISYRII